MSNTAQLDQNVAQLEAQLAAAKQAAAAAKVAARASIVNDIKAQIAANGVTAAELGFKGGKAAKGAKSAATGKTVAVKYRNGTDTWTGRGVKPRWLSAALAAGKSLASFAV